VTANLLSGGVRRARMVVVRCLALSLAMAGLGMVLAASPAGADPLASVSVIVNRPPVTGLLSLCVTSQSLDPNGTCLSVGSLPPSLSTGPLVSDGTAGAITETSDFPPSESISFEYNGQITLRGRTFHGDAMGAASVAPGNSVAVLPFLLTAYNSSDTLSATCSGEWHNTPGGFGVGAAVSVLTCTGSVNGGPPGTTTLVAGYAVTSSNSRPHDDRVGYSGVFAGV
jgi:hypothetical protein